MGKPLATVPKVKSQPTVPQAARRGPPEAHARVARLQAAVDAMGDDDGPEMRTLREALKKAKQETSAAPVGVRLDACAQFVERARARLSRADDVCRKAQEERVKFERESREGEERLEQLWVEASEEEKEKGEEKKERKEKRKRK